MSRVGGVVCIDEAKIHTEDNTPAINNPPFVGTGKNATYELYELRFLCLKVWDDEERASAYITVTCPPGTIDP